MSKINNNDLIKNLDNNVSNITIFNIHRHIINISYYYLNYFFWYINPSNFSNKLDYEKINKLNDKEFNVFIYRKKIAYSYWWICNYSLTFTFMYPLFYKYLSKYNGKLSMFGIMILSYTISLYTNKYFIRFFNKESVQDYNIYCLKRGLSKSVI